MDVLSDTIGGPASDVTVAERVFGNTRTASSCYGKAYHPMLMAAHSAVTPNHICTHTGVCRPPVLRPLHPGLPYLRVLHTAHVDRRESAAAVAMAGLRCVAVCMWGAGHFA